jgi:hypothetical protein
MPLSRRQVYGQPMQIATPRFVLRDFDEPDRTAFVRYQTDPRY